MRRASAPVSIRPVGRGDAAAMHAAMAEAEAGLSRWMPWHRPGHPLAAVEAWAGAAAAARVEGRAYEFVIEGEGRVLGACGLADVDAVNRCGKVGYWVRASAGGRGAATEAVRLLAAWAWAETDLERLEIRAAVKNVASRRVAEKAGAVLEGVARRRFRLHGRQEDAAVYALLRPEVTSETP